MSEMSERLSEVIGAVDKGTKDHLQFGRDVTMERIETPSVGVNRAMNGGWAKGRMGLIWGPRSAGKSTFVLQQIAIAQAQGKVCAYFDVERTFDKEWAEKQGVDIDELIYVKAGTIHSVVNDGVALMKAGADLISVDSITAIMPSTFLEDNGELKPFEKTGAIGGLARSLSPALAQLTYANDHDTSVLFVSQVRMAQKGSMYWGMSPSGGKAMDHATSQSLRLTSSSSNAINGEVVQGDLLLEQQIGREVNWILDKDKTGGKEGDSGKYNLYTAGDFLGVDTYEEMVRIGSELGIIDKAGAWFSYKGDQLGQGSSRAADKLREDSELFEEIKERFYGR